MFQRERKVGQGIVVHKAEKLTTTIRILAIEHGIVRLGIEADPLITVDLEEDYAELEGTNGQADQEGPDRTGQGLLPGPAGETQAP